MKTSEQRVVVCALCREPWVTGPGDLCGACEHDDYGEDDHADSVARTRNNSLARRYFES